MTRSQLRNRRGVALPLALLAMVVIGALMAGAFFSSAQEYKVGRNTLVSQRAFAVAEYGLNYEIANWNRRRFLPGDTSYMAPGNVDSTGRYVANGDTAYIKVSRLNDNTFWVVSEGYASMGSKQLKSRQRTNAVVRIAYPGVNVRGALTTAGNVEVTGAGRIYGAAQVNASEWKDKLGKWTQCASIGEDSLYGVSMGPTATLQDKKSNITGAPAGVERSAVAASDSTYIQYGDETWNSLVANADIKLTSATSTSSPAPSETVVNGKTVCNTSDPANWGEPARDGNGYKASCTDYYPIVYINGDASFHGGRGQGIMIVNGNIDFNGGFEWYGLIVVKDEVNKANGNANIFGAIMARAATVGKLGDADTDNWFSGSQNVFYSQCALESALRGSAILIPVKQRSWAQFY